jgi:sugar lactone lactonase YvrE
MRNHRSPSACSGSWRMRPSGLLTIVALGFVLGGCNSSSGSGSPNPRPKPTPTLTTTATQTATATATIAPTATPTATPSNTGGLWVPNLFGPSVNEFDPASRAVSGNPSPQFFNESKSLLLPAGLAFDSSENLWVANCSDPILGAGAITEFTAAQLANLGNNSTPVPNNALLDDGSLKILSCPWGEQFDVAGNLWVLNRLIPNLVSYTPAQLTVGGALTPDTTITSTFFNSPRSIVFDAGANLWIVENQNQQVLGYKAATLAAALGHSGQVNPDIVISSSSFGDPRAIAFDAGGNLWLGDATGKLLEFAAADLVMSGTPTPKVTITATAVVTQDGIAMSLDFPEGLAFDPAGDLWVANQESDNAGSLAEFTPPQLANSGSPSPAVFLDSDIFGINIHQPALLTFGPIP